MISKPLFSSLTGAEWRIYTSMYKVIFSSGNGLLVRGEMVKKQSNRALCDTILKFGMVLGYAMGITKTTGYKLASPSGGQ